MVITAQDLSVSTIAASGGITCTTLGMTGALSGATTGGFSGAVSAGSLALSGALTGATTGAFSSTVSMAGLTCTTGTFSGAVSGITTLAIGGALSGATTIAASGRVTSSVATGNAAFSQLTGARFYTNGGTDTRYLSDDGTNVALTGPVTMSSSLAITGALSGVTTIAASGAVTSSVASGSAAFSQLQGARHVTNGGTNTRYMSDDGTNIAFTGPVTMSGALAITGALSGVTTAAISGKITSTVASGSVALQFTQGARLDLGSSGARYLYDDVSGVVACNGPFTVVGSLTCTSGTVFCSNGFAAASGGIGLFAGWVADSGSAIGTKIYNIASLSTAGSKIASFYNDNRTNERAYFGWQGGLRTNAANTALPTASATYRGQIMSLDSGTGVGDVLYCCMKGTADTYSWVAVHTAP